MTGGNVPGTKFSALVQEQIFNEFTGAQQYVAIAVYFDGADLPQLAKHFYNQAVEERNHAMLLYNTYSTATSPLRSRESTGYAINLIDRATRWRWPSIRNVRSPTRSAG